MENAAQALPDQTISVVSVDDEIEHLAVILDRYLHAVPPSAVTRGLRRRIFVIEDRWAAGDLGGLSRGIRAFTGAVRDLRMELLTPSQAEVLISAAARIESLARASAPSSF